MTTPTPVIDCISCFYPPLLHGNVLVPYKLRLIDTNLVRVLNLQIIARMLVVAMAILEGVEEGVVVVLDRTSNM